LEAVEEQAKAIIERMATRYVFSELLRFQFVKRVSSLHSGFIPFSLSLSLSLSFPFFSVFNLLFSLHMPVVRAVAWFFRKVWRQMYDRVELNESELRKVSFSFSFSFSFFILQFFFQFL
jgi:hypothetical protein